MWVLKIHLALCPGCLVVNVFIAFLLLRREYQAGNSASWLEPSCTHGVAHPVQTDVTGISSVSPLDFQLRSPKFESERKLWNKERAHGSSYCQRTDVSRNKSSSDHFCKSWPRVWVVCGYLTSCGSFLKGCISLWSSSFYLSRILLNEKGTDWYSIEQVSV